MEGADPAGAGVGVGVGVGVGAGAGAGVVPVAGGVVVDGGDPLAGSVGASQGLGMSATGKIHVAERITPCPLLKLRIVLQLHPINVLMYPVVGAIAFRIVNTAANAGGSVNNPFRPKFPQRNKNKGTAPEPVDEIEVAAPGS